MKENKYTYEDVFNALNSMDEEKREFLIERTDMPELLNLLNSEDAFEATLENVDDYIARYQLWQSYLLELKTRLVTGEHRTTGAIDKDTISEKYAVLDDDEKKYIVLNLMNNADFQKKCCEILCSDMKRSINDDATLKALDQLFGVSKYFDRLISAGIGCEHKYRIE